MTNEEIQHLVLRKGLDNYVTIRGSDLQRLLDLQQPYDFLMQYVKEMAEYPWSPEIQKEEIDEWNKQLTLAWDHVVRGGIPMRAGFALVALYNMIDKAQSLRMVNPPSSWEPDTPEEGG